MRDGLTLSKLCKEEGASHLIDATCDSAPSHRFQIPFIVGSGREKRTGTRLLQTQVDGVTLVDLWRVH